MPKLTKGLAVCNKRTHTHALEYRALTEVYTLRQNAVVYAGSSLYIRVAALKERKVLNEIASHTSSGRSPFIYEGEVVKLSAQLVVKTEHWYPNRGLPDLRIALVLGHRQQSRASFAAHGSGESMAGG